MPRQDLHSNDVGVFCNKVMSKINYPEFYSQITNVYKLPKRFDLREKHSKTFQRGHTKGTKYYLVEF